MQLRLGKSTAADERVAAEEAVRNAIPPGARCALALVFTTVQFDPERLASEVSSALGAVPWAGCITPGVIVGGEVLGRGVVVGAFFGEDVRAGIGVGAHVAARPGRAGQAAAARAIAGLPPRSGAIQRLLIVFPGAITGNAPEVVRGAAREAGSFVHWAGGGSGDNLMSARAAQFADGHCYEDHAVVVAIDSPSRIGVGVHHGWRPYGPSTMVTRNDGALLQELDYSNAFEVYRATAEQLGDSVTRERFAEFAMMHPLGIPQAFGGHLIRDPLQVAPDGTIRFLAEVPDGTLVQMMVGEQQGLLDAARRAASDANRGTEGSPGAVLLFDCVSRYYLFGDRFHAELEAIASMFPPDVPLLGCLTLGEVAAFAGGVPQFHNKTSVVVGLS